MTLFRTVQINSVKPLLNAMETVENYESATCGESIKARALLTIQAIISLVALPIILLLGLISLAVLTCKGEGKKAANELWNCLKAHVVVAIPTSIIGPFIPLSATLDVANCLRDCAFPTSNSDETEKADDSNLSPPTYGAGMAGSQMNAVDPYTQTFMSDSVAAITEEARRGLAQVPPQYIATARNVIRQITTEQMTNLTPSQQAIVRQQLEAFLR